MTRYEQFSEIPKNRYNIIYADPPWQYDTENSSKPKKDFAINGVTKGYESMSLEEICALPINDIAAENTFLFLWTTFPMLERAIKVIHAWEFSYKTIGFSWVKTLKNDLTKHRFGVGWYTKSNVEPCLLAVKGHPRKEFIPKGPSDRKKVDSVIWHETNDDFTYLAPRRAHSEKPREARDRILQFCGDLPKIELFSRHNIEGWDSYGNQILGEYKTLDL